MHITSGTAHGEPVPAASPAGAPVEMRLCYGFNLGDRWLDLARGPVRDRLIGQLQAAGTEQVRVFLEPSGESSADYWPQALAALDAITRTGAIPMIALPNPTAGADDGARRVFAARCAEMVDRCGERFGGDALAGWFWSIGDEPNSPWTNGGLTFEGYRDSYQAAAEALKQRLGPSAGRPRIGGPSIDGFQPFWFDWIHRLIEEVDEGLLGFISWNRYGEWREPGAWAAPADPLVFERLLLSRTAEYWSRAAAIGTLLEGRGLLNICSELNAHSHTDPAVSGAFNQGVFGAVYYAAALIELMRGGADGEFLWAGAGVPDPYGAITEAGDATPAYEAKRLIATHVRAGDALLFPLDADPEPDLDAVTASSSRGRRAALVVHRCRRTSAVDLDRWPALTGFEAVTVVHGQGQGAESRPVNGSRLAFDGYAVALLHNGEDL